MICQYYYEDRSAVQIGDETGQKAGAIRMSLLRIRKALGQCVRASGGGEL